MMPEPLEIRLSESLSECAGTTVASSQMQVTPQDLVRQPYPRQRAMPGGDRRPCVPPGRAHRCGDPPPRPPPAPGELLKRPPPHQPPRDQPERLPMIPNSPEITEHPGAIRDRARQ